MCTACGAFLFGFSWHAICGHLKCPNQQKQQQQTQTHMLGRNSAPKKRKNFVIANNLRSLNDASPVRPCEGAGRGGGGGWHKASVSDCLPLAAPIGLSPLLILTLCGPERVLVVSTEPLDDWAGGGGGGWHKALVVGSVSLWRRLLASRP